MMQNQNDSYDWKKQPGAMGAVFLYGLILTAGSIFAFTQPDILGSDFAIEQPIRLFEIAIKFGALLCGVGFVIMSLYEILTRPEDPETSTNTGTILSDKLS